MSTIKVIATDMDGTFLTSQNDYDREGFAHLFEQMKEQGVRFVAISGNQYYQIKSFFPDLHDQMTIVGENGAYLVEKGQFIKSHRLPIATVRLVLDYVTEQGFDKDLVLCGEASAYLLADCSQEAKDYFAIYYHKLQEVATFSQLPEDHFMKFSFNTPEDQTYAIVEALNQRLGDAVVAVTSGHGNIDIIAKGVNKGSALTFLLERWGLSADQLLAFGDSGNDLEMLELAKYGYAMANASEEIKAAANYQAPSHNDSGVLRIMEDYLAKI